MASGAGQDSADRSDDRREEREHRTEVVLADHLRAARVLLRLALRNGKGVKRRVLCGRDLRGLSEPGKEVLQGFNAVRARDLAIESRENAGELPAREGLLAEPLAPPFQIALLRLQPRDVAGLGPFLTPFRVGLHESIREHERGARAQGSPDLWVALEAHKLPQGSLERGALRRDVPALAVSHLADVEGPPLGSRHPYSAAPSLDREPCHGRTPNTFPSPGEWRGERGPDGQGGERVSWPRKPGAFERRIPWNVRSTERWPSGRRRTLGKRVYGNVSWVRIPPSPPTLCYRVDRFWRAGRAAEGT